MPRGEPGELLSRGYIVMLGYWNNPEATAQAIDAGRWMHTGDLATMDDEGYVNIVGRSKDMIIRGGENIYPREIEEFLYAHPKIQRRAGDRRAGREVRRGGDGLGRSSSRARRATDEELRDFCRGRIAHYKVPRYWRFTDALPDDRHRQDSEVQDARDRDRRTWPPASGGNPDGVAIIGGGNALE